jgi:hypothetical protein
LSDTLAGNTVIMRTLAIFSPCERNMCEKLLPIISITEGKNGDWLTLRVYNEKLHKNH